MMNLAAGRNQSIVVVSQSITQAISQSIEKLANIMIGCRQAVVFDRAVQSRRSIYRTIPDAAALPHPPLIRHPWPPVQPEPEKAVSRALGRPACLGAQWRCPQAPQCSRLPRLHRGGGTRRATRQRGCHTLRPHDLRLQASCRRAALPPRVAYGVHKTSTQAAASMPTHPPTQNAAPYSISCLTPTHPPRMQHHTPSAV